mgnify:CR=1 FL=1
MSTTVPRSSSGVAPAAYDATLTRPPAARERLTALDVFRGLTIAGMLLVNNPGSWSAIYPPLRHAAWHGWTPTDLIFPFFLFIVGITTHLSLAARRARGDDDGKLVRQVLRRGGIIILLGLLLSGFPFIPKYGFDLATMRIPGVLQRIGVAYIAAALLTLRTSAKAQLLIVASLLLGYWALMTLVPVPGSGMVGALALAKPDASLAAWLDRTVLGNHLWKVSKTWDPEGILSTIPAIGTAMLGVLAGRWIASPRPLIERIADQLSRRNTLNWKICRESHGVACSCRCVWTSLNVAPSVRPSARVSRGEASPVFTPAVYASTNARLRGAMSDNARWASARNR